MIYANDDSDKELRKKHFLLYCYGVPIIIAILICLLIYSIDKAKLLSATDIRTGYIAAFFSAIYIHLAKRREWVKLPGSSYYNIKGSSFVSNKKEPSEYEAVYFVSKKIALVAIFYAIAVIAGSIYYYKKVNAFFLPIYFIVVAVLLARQGIIMYGQKQPKLKLAKEGLWTARLGFREWKEVVAARVSKSERKESQLILSIYLYGTVFAEANLADDVISLNGIEDKDFIETVVDSLKDRYTKERGSEEQ